MKINSIVVKRLFLISALVAPLLLSGCSVDAGTDAGTSETSQSEDSSQNSTAVVGVGETITGEDFSITLNSASRLTKDSFGSKAENAFYLILDVTVENKSGDDLTSSSLMSYELKGSDDYTYDQSITVDKKGSLDGTIASKSKLRGQIAYDVPDLDSFIFSYKPGLFGDPVQFTIKSTDIK